MDVAQVLDQLRERFLGLGARLIDFLPSLIAALFIFLAGWALAWVARRVVARLTRSFAVRIPSVVRRNFGLNGQVGESLPRVLGAISYWVLILVFAAVAVEQLEIGVITDLFARLTQYLPDVVLGMLIVLVGIVSGHGARRSIESAPLTGGLEYVPVLGRVAEVGIIATASLIALDQVGVESTLLIVVIALVAGVSLGGIALAFGVGAGPMVRNIIASYDVRKRYSAGQLVQIASTRGRILEIGSSFVTIDTEHGVVHIPAGRFSDEVSVAVRE